MCGAAWNRTIERDSFMASTDLQLAPAYLPRLRRLYPGAIDVGRVRGSRHTVKALVHRMEKRGEIVAVERFTREIRPGVLEIPYVRLKTVEQVRRIRRLKVGAFGLGALATAYGAGWLVWESRFVIALFAAVALAGGVLLYLSLHWSNGCSGIHCSGCRG